ncbi:MAG: hypothetical protein COB37_03650 [Kordiimonadales bacterium]|nr:MAG: hypothetical protein COB37_03650 [Kordiimonadales bacterium]
MNSAAKTYQRDLFLALGLYAVVLFGVNYFIGANEGLASWIIVLLAILPVLPALLALKVALVFYKSVDELQKKIMSESVIISFLLVGFGTFTYGFLEGAGFPHLPSIWILPALIGFQGLALAFVSRKYK